MHVAIVDNLYTAHIVMVRERGADATQPNGGPLLAVWWWVWKSIKKEALAIVAQCDPGCKTTGDA